GSLAQGRVLPGQKARDLRGKIDRPRCAAASLPILGCHLRPRCVRRSIGGKYVPLRQHRGRGNRLICKRSPGRTKSVEDYRTLPQWRDKRLPGAIRTSEGFGVLQPSAAFPSRLPISAQVLCCCYLILGISRLLEHWCFESSMFNSLRVI